MPEEAGWGISRWAEASGVLITLSRYIIGVLSPSTRHCAHDIVIGDEHVHQDVSDGRSVGGSAPRVREDSRELTAWASSRHFCLENSR